jgi:PAS domain S-box-containing protein
MVEDSPEDAELVERQVTKGGYQVTVVRVTDANAMQQSLLSAEWDVVLSDYHVPGFGAVPALEVLKHSRLDIPFIILSGVVSDEQAVAAMRAGAHDYLRKDNLSRLTPVIEREIQEAARRRLNRQMEAKLQLQSAALDSAANSIVITDRAGTIQWVNSAFTELTGYGKDEAIGQNPRVLKSGKHDDQIYKKLWNTVISGSVWRGEIINRRKNGSLYVEEMTITPVRMNGTISHFIAVKEDITERRQSEDARKQAEDAVRSSQTKLQGIISSAMDAVISVDEKQRVVVFNQAAETAFQCSAAEALGSTLDRFIPESLREVHHDHIRRFGLDRTTARSMRSPGLLNGVRANGETFPIEATISQVQTEGEKLYTVILRDISERKQAENLLREQANLLDLAHDAIMVRDLDGTIRFWNHGAEEMYGFSKQQATGRISHDLLRTVFPQPLEEIDRELLRGARWDGELIHTAHDGTRILVASRWASQQNRNGFAIGVMEINHDITARKQAEQALIRSEKLASVGRLAATIAHEINNPLSSALNALYLVRTDPALHANVKDHIALAEQELGRVAHITKQTLGFYREVGNPAAVDVPMVCDSLLELLGPKLRNKNISVRRSYRSVAGIDAIDGEFRQIVSNLITNSIDALPHGGNLHVRLAGPQALRNARRMVRITIADDGEGIAVENLKEIFEPFFTTRQSIGTGLGLWVTSELIKKHEGRLRLRSRVGRGTVVTIWLPVERRGPDRRSS